MRAQTFQWQRYDISICGILLEIRKFWKMCAGEAVRVKWTWKRWGKVDWELANVFYVWVSVKLVPYRESYLVCFRWVNRMANGISPWLFWASLWHTIVMFVLCDVLRKHPHILSKTFRFEKAFFRGDEVAEEEASPFCCMKGTEFV